MCEGDHLRLIEHVRRSAAKGPVLGALVLAAVACSGDDEAAPGSSGAATTVTTELAATLPAGGTDETGPTVLPTAESTSGTARPTSTSAPAAEYDFSGVSPIVERFIDERGLNGAGLIVVDRDDGIVDEEYWGEFGPDRVSLIASSSKMITAGVLLRLQDDGLLDIDAPVAAVVDWGAREPDDHACPAAVEQLGARWAVPGPGVRSVRVPVSRGRHSAGLRSEHFLDPERRRRHRGVGHRVPLWRRPVAGGGRRRRGRLGQTVGSADR